MSKESEIGYTVTIYGKPQPQGSTRSFTNRGRTVTTSANKKLKPWRQHVSEVLMYECGYMPYAGDGKESVKLKLDFFFQRPVSVSKKRTHMTVRPDLDKLVRAILDAGTGILYKDDSQVVEIQTRKHYGDPERVEIKVEVAEWARRAL